MATTTNGTTVPASPSQLTPQQREMQEKHGAIVPTLQLTFANCKKLKSFIKDYSYNCGKSVKINNNSQAVTYLCSDDNCQWKITAVKPRSDRNETDAGKKGQFKITKVHNVHSYHCSSVSKTSLRQQRVMKHQVQATIRASLGQAPLPPHKMRGRPRKQPNDIALSDIGGDENVNTANVNATATAATSQQLPPTAEVGSLITVSEMVGEKMDDTIHGERDLPLTTAIIPGADHNCRLHNGQLPVEEKSHVCVDAVLHDDDDDVDDPVTPVLLSNGPFTVLPYPTSLALDRDKEWSTPFHCFVRKHCVEVFTATLEDVSLPSKGKHRSISVGQIGIRCQHCHKKSDTEVDGPISSKAATKPPLPPFAHPHQVGGSIAGSCYYPASLKQIYSATMLLLQRHFCYCSDVPCDIKSQYEILRLEDSRSGTPRRYWEASAACIGLVDTLDGIRFSSLPPPPLPSMETIQGHGKMFDDGTGESIGVDDNDLLDAYEAMGSPLENQHQQRSLKTNKNQFYKGLVLVPEDKPFATLYSYFLMDQMTPTTFTEADQLGKQKALPNGFPGLACKHCIGDYGTGRFFASTVKTLGETSKTLNVMHNHIMRCHSCPIQIREALDKLRHIHDEERSRMDCGSQQKFFQRIWDRLHHGISSSLLIRSANTNPEMATFGITSPLVTTTPAATNIVVPAVDTATPSIVIAAKTSFPIGTPASEEGQMSLKRDIAEQSLSPQSDNKQRKLSNTVQI
jgi:hypothetical protein